MIARLDLLCTRFPRSSLAALAERAEAVIKVAPHDLEALGTLGQARFLQGNAPAGQRALSVALELDPSDTRLREQLATGLLETRQFALAEQTWTQLSGSPVSSLSQATAVLLSGERARAASVLDVGLQANPLAPVIRAEWAAIGAADVNKGPQLGLGTLQGQTQLTGDRAALAAMQAAVWSLQSGDNQGAKAFARQGLQSASNPEVKQTADAIALIVNAGSASALQSRVEAGQANGATKNILLGYGLFLCGDYNGSAAQWRSLIAASGDTDLRSRTMLANCLQHAGKSSDAFGIVVQPFVPNLSGIDPFATIAFNEMRQLLRL